MSATEIPDEAFVAADRIYGGQIPYDGLRQIIAAALPFILPGEIAEAEKRGAVRILRHVADRTERQLATGMPLAKTVDEAMTQAIDGLRRIADRTERDGIPGEVTL